jgi:hypothetical protein
MKAFLAHLVRAAMFVVRALLHCAWFAMRPALAMLCYLLAQYLAAFVAFCAITLMGVVSENGKNSTLRRATAFT